MHQFKAPHDMFKYAPRYDEFLEDIVVPEPDDLYQLNKQFGSVATRGINDSLRKTIGTSVSKRHERRSLGEDMGVDTALPDNQFTKEAYQTFLKAYLRCVKGVDDNFGRLIQYLKDSGEYDNTIIIYTSDQGMMLGEHDYQDKRWMFEESIQMPFIVKHPKSTENGKRKDLIVNNTDFAPFILSLAGVNKPTYMQGEDFSPTLFGEQPENWREATYYRYWTHRAYHDVPAHMGVRSKDFKLIFYYGENHMTEPRRYYDRKWVNRTGLSNNAIATPVAWELYDLRLDPNETINVYADAKYRHVVSELKQELRKQRIKYKETDKQYPHLQTILDKHW